MPEDNSTIATLTNGEGAAITLQIEHCNTSKGDEKPVAIMQVTSPDGDRFIGIKLNYANRYRLRRMLELMDA